MGTALRKHKYSKGNKKLSDWKTIGGAGRLIGTNVDKLRVFYRLAIRRNKSNLEGMKNEDI